MAKLNEEILRDFQVRTEIDGEFEVMESDELGVDEAYENELIKELGVDVDSSVFSYAIAEVNDEENMYTLEYSHEGVLLTIHDYDEDYVPQTIYKNII
ncbi:hypothetical protein CPT_MarsHill_035 [Staphylococcus phage MarsHill]|nr:hypothetical protein CPT_MarsHill_035 [Staphylococcus phage MarsHill]QQO92691.1 hypothetical protein CPT_Madawaska_034 [Staphylococcus phage Madawaska]